MNQANPLSILVVTLLKGVLDQESDAERWNSLLIHQAGVRDYVSVLGLELILDEAEGYAFLRSKPAEGEKEDGSETSAAECPRLMARRRLSFPVSLLLALLRKKLAEFDAQGGAPRLVLSRDEIIELVRVFLPENNNEVRFVNQIDEHIHKIAELGFLRRLKSENTASGPSFEVRRILQAFVDAQWLADFRSKLQTYREYLEGRSHDSAVDA
ncbi:MAG TPA: hypothetical protein DF383_11355 [Deltaproteobacteria bacterium]|nr:hypothetical protein [Deltaproteobacteria bacterium]